MSPLQLLEVHVVAEAQLAPVASLEALVGPAVVGKAPAAALVDVVLASRLPEVLSLHEGTEWPGRPPPPPHQA